MEIDHVEEHLVNGALMKKYAGQQVRVWLQTSGDTSAGGRQLQGITADKKTVTVSLESPLNQPLSGWIEIFGTPTPSGTTINCSEIVVFPSDENSEPFDEEAHNNLVFILDNMRAFDETGQEF